MNELYNNKKNRMLTNDVIVNYIVNLGSLLVSVISIGIWGGNISARVARIEKEAEGSDQRQTRIEKKLDRMQTENNRLLHEFKDEIIRTIINNKDTMI